ncbi:MAG: extracellular solute-binding protein [Rhodospirillales bacterium]|nr:extracellular solute-binding protein [Rhodospirillales bacterium]HJO72929.1 extracellular solute-binding protein [Rhodospirillales bacterium]
MRELITPAGLMAVKAALALAFVLSAVVASPDAGAEAVKPRHAIAMHGTPKYGPDFKHFDYVNPEAPKGGAARYAAIGTFDNLNPFILKGHWVAGAGALFETLTTRAQDEAFTNYGLLAESIEMPDDRSWVAFTLRKEARWHDGRPMTPEDVIFSLDVLKNKGHPRYRFYYANVAKAEKVGPRKVRFTFSGPENTLGPRPVAAGPGCEFTLSSSVNRELPLIVGEMAILPRHYWQGKDFTKTTLDPGILGSGPYRIKSFEPGRTVVYERDRNYWGADLPVNRGSNNFDIIRYDYYRDSTVALEAFKAGAYDFRMENTSKSWATAYDSPAVKAGLIKKEEIRHELGTGMQAFVFNTRQPIFRDRRVRQALAYAFDFEWTNKNLFYGQYTRTASYFSNTELASRGKPGPEELKILECFRGRIADEVFSRQYKVPASDGSGNIRRNLRAALRLLGQAGWVVKDGKLVSKKTGQRLSFEILLNQPIWERIALPFKRNLAKLGVEAKIRTVDTAQYQKRTEKFDFDMIVDVFGQSLSPGNEQRDLWGSISADREGGRNTIGIKDPVIDQLTDLVIAAPDRENLIARTRALDRVLLWGYYVIPHWHIRTFRVAAWDKFGRPKETPKYGLGLGTWWVDAAKAASLEERKKRLR